MARSEETERPATGASQLDMFGAPPAQSYEPDPESVRAELKDLLARARAAPFQHWDPREISFYRVVFPQMANWLPKDEAAQLCFEFEAEIARLKAA